MLRNDPVVSFQLLRRDAMPPPFLLSECGLFYMFKTGRGMATRYTVLEFDAQGDCVARFAADRLGAFYQSRVPWNFPFTAKPSPADCVLPVGWTLQALGPHGFQRFVTQSAPCFEGDPRFPSGSLAVVQLWDGEEWVNYIEGDFLALQRLIGFYASDWLADLGQSGGFSHDVFPVWAMCDD